MPKARQKAESLKPPSAHLGHLAFTAILAGPTAGSLPLRRFKRAHQVPDRTAKSLILREEAFFARYVAAPKLPGPVFSAPLLNFPLASSDRAAEVEPSRCVDDARLNTGSKGHAQGIQLEFLAVRTAAVKQRL
ncbi:hypothetical protein [Paraburkholderia sp. RL17-337-BIB-A]|uniref:hypothetical protein n=1 Tax=Paraburkholderia sp. RL17-337-BIB-A TaxID=3031636 RepID=UPI0038BA0996